MSRRLVRTVFLALAAAWSLSSCAILSPPAPRSGGAGLSDGAKETAKKPEDQQPVEAGEQTGDASSMIGIGIALAHHRDEALDDPASLPTLDLEPRPRRSPFAGWHLGTAMSRGAVDDADFGTSTLFGLRGGARPASRLSLDLALMGGPSKFAAGSDVAALLRDPLELVADGSARFAVTPPNAFLGIAPVAGIRLGTLFWRYRNGLDVDRDGELHHVTGDWLDYYTPYAGVALTVAPSSRFAITALALTGWRIYDGHTNEGLRNDLFPDARFNEVRIETTIPF